VLAKGSRTIFSSTKCQKRWRTQRVVVPQPISVGWNSMLVPLHTTAEPEFLQYLGNILLPNCSHLSGEV